MLVLRQTASIFAGLRLFAQRLRQMSSPVSFGYSPGFARCLRLSATALRQASPDVFACQLHPFTRFRLIARSVIPTWLLRGSSIQSMTEGGVPNSSPSRPWSFLGRPSTSIRTGMSSPEALAFGPRLVALRSAESRVTSIGTPPVHHLGWVEAHLIKITKMC